MIQLPQLLPQCIRLTLTGSGVEGHDRREALGAAGSAMAVMYGGMKLADHRFGHRPLLGLEQAPVAAGVGGIDDHRAAGRHRLLQTLH